MLLIQLCISWLFKLIINLGYLTLAWYLLSSSLAAHTFRKCLVRLLFNDLKWAYTISYNIGNF